MLYTILIFSEDDVFENLPKEKQEQNMARHQALQKKLQEDGRPGPAIKLMGSSAAVSVRGRGENILVTDGPFAETKEQILGLYLIDCDSMEQAIEYTKMLPLDVSSYEIRPVEWPNAQSVPFTLRSE